jgi:hypothetical protein
MADEQDEPQLPDPTPPQNYAPPLPRQLQAEVDAANQLREQMAMPDQEPEGEEPEGEEYEEEQQELPFEEDDQTWEQRARSTAGRLEQALTANQQMAQRLTELENSMATGRLRAPAPEPAAPKQRQRYLKEEEIQDYGEEFFDVVGRRAKEEFDPILDQLGERIKRLESGQQAVGQVVEQTQKRSMMDQLTDAVPEWRTINHHPDFFQWLSYPDPYSGRQRHEMLKEAYSRHDVQRVVNFFKGFVTEATGTPPNASSSPRSSAPPPANGSASERPSLEDFAAPGRARSAPQNLPPEKPVYTQAQIAQFATDKRKGLYRGREAEAEAYERDIFQAQHEGRIF